jgi:hypothetical protein
LTKLPKYCIVKYQKDKGIKGNIMRTIEKTLYKFDELEWTAQEKALNEWISSGDTYGWEYENVDSLNAFTEVFGIEIGNWEYGDHNYINFSVKNVEDYDSIYETEELTGLKLYKRIANIYYNEVQKGKYYSTMGRWVDGKYTYKKRYSKVIKDNGGCPFTGYCMDDTLLDSIIKYLKTPDLRMTYKELMSDCLDNWLYACRDDYEHSMSMEYFEEMCEANEWEFYENGSMC